VENSAKLTPPGPPSCSQRNRRGGPCGNPAYGGTDRCWAHLRTGPEALALDDDVLDRLEAMLRAGNYLHVAVRAAGIARATFAEWLGRAKSEAPEDEPYRELRDRVERARAVGQTQLVESIAAAAVDDWRAATWLLERQHPTLWGGVSVRVREEAPPPEADLPDADDPFAEVDELAERRAQRPG
jgi:hypothetical protein